MKPAKYILPIIVWAQFCCTSLWFASNAIIKDLVTNFGLASSAFSILTSAVQFGFITGTLLFAIFTITDRFAPSRVFFCCAILGGLSNLALIWSENTLGTLLIFRFGTGFFLAGIYPVGMKIAADHFNEKLGTSLGYLVGALVIGTAFPHLLNTFDQSFSWISVIQITTVLAILGGSSIWIFVPNGPFRSPSQKLKIDAFLSVFKKQEFRKAAFGYFGHMWELYTFWAFIPIFLATFTKLHSVSLSISLWSFIIIASGGLGCITAGYLSQKLGIKNTARFILLLSGLCCLLLPLFFMIKNVPLFLIFMVFWGIVVIADSPLFSTLVAKNAIPKIKGTALTIVNCIGFAITIISLQTLNFILQYSDSIWVYTILLIGPLFGVFHLFKKQEKPPVHP